MVKGEWTNVQCLLLGFFGGIPNHKKISDIKVTTKSLMNKILLQLFGADQLEIEEIERYISRYVLIAEGKEV